MISACCRFTLGYKDTENRLLAERGLNFVRGVQLQTIWSEAALSARTQTIRKVFRRERLIRIQTSDDRGNSIMIKW